MGRKPQRGHVLGSGLGIQGLVHATCASLSATKPLNTVAVQATLAACNVAATLSGHPVWNKPDVLPFVDGPFDAIPKAAPSIVNAKELSLAMA